MNCPITDFFIVLQRTQDVFAFKAAQGGQPPDCADRAFDSCAVDIPQFFERTADARSRNHPIAYGFAVFDSGVV
jgi:hypothetical protein